MRPTTQKAGPSKLEAEDVSRSWLKGSGMHRSGELLAIGSRLWEMAQWVKCLLCIHEDLSSNP